MAEKKLDIAMMGHKHVLSREGGIEIVVKERKVGLLRINGKEYISLTDLARYADAEEPRLPIRDWMRNKEVISYLGFSNISLIRYLIPS